MRNTVIVPWQPEGACEIRVRVSDTRIDGVSWESGANENWLEVCLEGVWMV